MVKEKISFEQFIEVVEADHRPFIQDLHNYLVDSNCKVSIEAKKSGYLASYKYGKPPRAAVNLLFRKKGMLVRIYGENVNKYLDILNTLPEDMVRSIENSSECKRLVSNTCSPTCSGYDFIIGNERFQKCRYSCFEFLVTKESIPRLKSFVEREIRERQS